MSNFKHDLLAVRYSNAHNFWKVVVSTFTKYAINHINVRKDLDCI